MIHLREVTLRYDARDLALDGVSLDVAAGESCAIVGPSGSGKTTLLHCCSGLLQPDAGVVRVHGTDMAKAGPAARRRARLEDIGVVLQDGQLLTELNVVDNVALPGRLRGLTRREAARRAAKVLGELGVAELAGRSLSELSGGQYQRVAVARAVTFAPAVVLADEPTGALDSVNRVRVFDLLLACSVKLGAAVVVVTHDLGLAARCTRHLDLVDGKLEVG